MSQDPLSHPTNPLLQTDHLLDAGQFVRTCSIWRALNVVGDVASLLVLQAIWMQQHRFGQMLEYTRLPKAVLSNRLQRLLELGVLENADTYRLTDKGLDLFNVVMMLLRWEVNWSSPASRLSVVLTHTDCGHVMTPTPACGDCQHTFTADDVSFEPGPGIGMMTPVYPRRRQSKTRLTESESTLLFTESADVLGDRWSALVIRSLFTGLVHFDQIREDLAIATNILSERLRWLMSIDAIQATGPSNREYGLTEKGRDFIPVLIMLQAWGDVHCPAPEGPPVVVTHTTCGQPLIPAVICDQCRQSVNTRNTSVEVNTP